MDDVANTSKAQALICNTRAKTREGQLCRCWQTRKHVAKLSVGYAHERDTYLWRLERVVRRELNFKKEYTAIVRAVLLWRHRGATWQTVRSAICRNGPRWQQAHTYRSHDGGTPFEVVVAFRTGTAVRWWILAEIVQLLIISRRGCRERKE